MREALLKIANNQSVSRHSIFLGFAVIFWLVPYFWCGWTEKPWDRLPRAVTFQHTSAGMFTARTTRWWDHHIEGLGMDGKRFEIPERAVFPMGAFGFRTRYDRILLKTNRSRLSGQVRRRLAEHIFRRLEGGAGTMEGRSIGSAEERLVPPLKSLQLVRSLWTVGTEALANPAGEWHPPPITEVKGANRQVLGTYQLVAGKVMEIRAPRALDAPQTAPRGTDPRVSSRVNPTGGANPAGGANAVSGANPAGGGNAVSGANPAGGANAVSGANPASGASAVVDSNATNSLPRRRPLVVPPSAAGGSNRISPSVLFPGRSGSPMKPVLPGDPSPKVPNAAGSNGSTLPNSANRRPGPPSTPLMQPPAPQPAGSGVK